MDIKKQSVTYTTTNTYETLNTLGNKTENVWLVLHGMGYLSRYFLRYFVKLNPEENYIIAPQAPSKYYLKDDFKHVGASWLTKEDTLLETENVLNYLNEVLRHEKEILEKKLIVFGFSQGVSIAMRWLAQRKLHCQTLVLYAGGIPNELKKQDFEFLDFSKTKVKIVYGNKDHYLTPKRLLSEYEKINTLFGEHAEIINFEGGHEINEAILEKIASDSSLGV
ncbi:esterase [uncultured Croceitalea sp.]|uniref:alpha/beta hydrolase n=1 Tax=uncultured Croceitalea sp. TaxID=1798908 RepID=UPI003305C9C7